jgi:hypothetical protein
MLMNELTELDETERNENKEVSLGLVGVVASTGVRPIVKTRILRMFDSWFAFVSLAGGFLHVPIKANTGMLLILDSLSSLE